MVCAKRIRSIFNLLGFDTQCFRLPFKMLVLLLCFLSHLNCFPLCFLHHHSSSSNFFYGVKTLVTAETVQATHENTSIYSNFVSERDVIVFQDTVGANRPVEGIDLYVTISRAWWNASSFLILKSHEQGFDVSSIVRSTVGSLFSHGEELLRLLNKQHADVIVLSPAFQWAQSLDTIYLYVKFAYRWSSPGALSVEEEKVETFENRFFFSGIGTHSGVKKKYELDLTLFDAILPAQTQWNFASVGKLYVELKKAVPAKWIRLTKDKKKIPNMLVWWDMQEKVDRERKGASGDVPNQSSISSTSSQSVSSTKKANEL